MSYETHIDIINAEDNKRKDWYHHTAKELMSISKGDHIVSLNKQHFFEVVAIFHTYLGADKHHKVIYVKEVRSDYVPYSNSLKIL
jgi:hypothetical protein